MSNQTPVLYGRESDVVNLFNSGITFEQMAEDLGVSLTSVFDKVKELGLTRPVVFKKKLEDRREEVIELLESGISIKEIAEILDVHPNTILRTRKAWGVYNELPQFYKKIQKTRKENKEAGIKPTGPTRFSCLDPFIDEIVEELENGATKAYIAKKYKVCIQTVFNVLNRHEITIKTDNNVQRLADDIKELFEKGFSYKEIAKKLNCSQQAVFNNIKKLKIHREKEDIVISCKIKKQEEKLIELFNKGLSHKEIAKELGCHAISVGQYIKRIGLKRSFLSVICGKEENIKQMLKQGLSQRAIAKELGICEKVLSYHIKKKGLNNA
ncbi:MAG: helix-turn-helix domain-containing protein [Alphaproteobacteria bacterium]